jgi:hypothetical protein
MAKPRSGHYKSHSINPRINLQYAHSNNTIMSYYLYEDSEHTL